MSVYLAIEFKDEKNAFRGVEALKALHADGSIAIYSGVIIEKNEKGEIVTKDSQGEPILGTLSGMVLGSLIGALAGPTGLAIGYLSGTTLGAIADMSNAGVGIDFADEIGKLMQPGTCVVMAEVEEYWTTPIDVKMEDVGGVVHRFDRIDVEAERSERKAQARRDEIQSIKDEWKTANADTKKKLKERADAVSKSIDGYQADLASSYEKFKSETKAKIDEISKQMKDSTEEQKAKMASRKQRLEEALEQRSKLLEEAKELKSEANALVKDALV